MKYRIIVFQSTVDDSWSWTVYLGDQAKMATTAWCESKEVALAYCVLTMLGQGIDSSDAEIVYKTREQVLAQKPWEVV